MFLECIDKDFWLLSLSSESDTMNDKKGNKKCYGVVMGLIMFYKSGRLFLVTRGMMIGKK